MDGDQGNAGQGRSQTCAFQPLGDEGKLILDYRVLWLC